jgi:hypothetical protein
MVRNAAQPASLMLFGEVAVPDQVRDPQIFETDRVILAQQGQRGHMMEVAPLAVDLLVVAFEQGDALRRRLLPFVCRLTRRWAVASRRSAFR